ncbi:unnamed protein product (macronuclear) [Paramecium tetraurelia]|uniref:Uncharacterized protein n=1 Tax=Paramecium tetraurelia TaxID=5888 RepID=A0CY74_PARTE|nr:uncharacterized protein GSPATT00039079001 [Paramecium tetraurelia]CAK75741.1 unnamed protein product [Paramecium tetraurelia]|eukprot:XP_001443138.1 hypothetical protein (macronuclear) [Paramecium tetraurelia strain d4-2]
MNNDLCLLIRQVRMPKRIQIPKQKKQPVFHKTSYTIPDKFYSDKEIMELQSFKLFRYFKKFIKVDVDESIALEIIQQDDFINCNINIKLGTSNTNQ